jgi:ABC-type Zn uptake system ZnuABC Zn-binding protein ZnuA
MIFRIVGDTIEYDGVPVATILPSAWPTLRDYVEDALESYDPDHEAAISAELDAARDELDEVRKTYTGEE